MKRCDKNEIIANEWISLRTLWDGCKAGATDHAREEIESLFAHERKWFSEAEDWDLFNLTEQLVGAQLTATQLDVEYHNLLDIARDRRRFSSLATYEGKAKLFLEPMPPGVTIDQRRATYLGLLQKLQSNFVEARTQRRLRRETATRLFYYGLLLFLFGFVLPSAFFWAGWLLPTNRENQPFGELGMVPLLVAVYGAIGAYFSRVMSFQSKLASVGFDDVMNLYQWRMLMLRLLYGSVAAAVFYLALRAGLIKGLVFRIFP